MREKLMRVFLPTFTLCNIVSPLTSAALRRKLDCVVSYALFAFRNAALSAAEAPPAVFAVCAFLGLPFRAKNAGSTALNDAFAHDGGEKFVFYP